MFEVPTTLEALHDMIATHASTGKDASTIIQRIHACNSVRLNRKNMEKMQNFYDVVLRRFIAIGDAIHRSGIVERHVGLGEVIGSEGGPAQVPPCPERAVVAVAFTGGCQQRFEQLNALSIW